MEASLELAKERVFRVLSSCTHSLFSSAVSRLMERAEGKKVSLVDDMAEIITLENIQQVVLDHDRAVLETVRGGAIEKIKDAS